MTLRICLPSSFSIFPIPKTKSSSTSSSIHQCFCKINPYEFVVANKTNKLKPCKNYSFYSSACDVKIPAAQIGAAELEDSTTKSGFTNLVWPSPDDKIPFWRREFPTWDINSVDSVNAEKDSDLLHIVHVTAEMAPIAKVGGLGDVVTGLARACITRGHKVDVMLPFYECIQRQYINNLVLISTYTSYFNGNWIPTNAYRGEVSGISVIFVEPSNHFFKGQSVYGGSYNELEAYLFFSRACLEWMQVTGTQPDIIHVHEWQTGVLPLLYWDMYQDLSLKKPRIVLTIHNMEHYGECRFFTYIFVCCSGKMKT